MVFKYGPYVLLVGLLIFGCEQKADNLSRSDLYAIAEQKSLEFRKVLLAGQLDSVMTYYDENAALSPDGFPLIVGKDSIQKFLAKGLKMAKFSKLEFTTDHVNGDKNQIYQMESVNSEIIVHDSLKFTQSAKFLYLWKLQKDGTYKIAVEVNNSNNEDEI